MPAAPTVTAPLRPDEKPLAAYRSISVTALIAAALGVASALVLVSPLLVPVPLAALLLAGLALRSIRASDGQVVGRVPAIVGLSLAVLFLSWGLARYGGRQVQLEKHGRRFAEGWLALIAEGKYQQAHQLGLSPSARTTTTVALEQYYAENVEAADVLKQLVSSPPVSELIAEGRDVRYRYDGVAGALRSGLQDHLTLKFVVERPGDRGGPFPLWIVLNRSVNAQTQQPEWVYRDVLATAP
jgi:hypothetical protein